MDIHVYNINTVPDDKIDELLDNHENFSLTGVRYMREAVLSLEKKIEGKGMKCRIYTKGRLASVGAAAIPVSPTVIGGWLAAATIGIHNLATFNPNYEIAKNPLTNCLDVKYKR